MVVHSDIAFSFVRVFLMILISLFGLVLFIVRTAERAFRPATKTLAVLVPLGPYSLRGHSNVVAESSNDREKWRQLL
jgi:hypothetical protein